MTTDDNGANPLLNWSGIHQFDQIEPKHVVPAVRRMLDRIKEDLEEIEENIEPTWDATFAKLERLDLGPERIWQPVDHLLSVRNSDDLRKAHAEVEPEVVASQLALAQSEPFYKAVIGIRDGDEWQNLDDAQRRVVESWITNAELSGIALEGDKKSEFNDIQTEHAELATRFSNNVLDAIKAFELIVTDRANVEGIPQPNLELAAQSYNSSDEDRQDATADEGPWRFTLDGPSYMAYMAHGPSRELREQLYRAFVTKASSGEFDNSKIIERLLALRHQKAQLLGKPTYAEVSLATKMAGQVEAVEKMFADLLPACREQAREELAVLRDFARAQGEENELMNWDINFWAERQKERLFSFREEELRPYFPIDKVLEGMFALTQKLFDVRVEAADGAAPIWHEDVRYYKVFNSDDQEIAGFYLDPFSRPVNKRGGAWMNDCLGRKIIDGKVQLPIVYLCCNGTPPAGDIPALMTFYEVETLFHEFGHGLQHMLTTIDVADAAGIENVEWDAVEIASQFMENWCYHRPTVNSLSAHYETGESLPDELFQKLLAAKNYRSATNLTRQISLGMTDLRLHVEYAPDPKGSPFEVTEKVVRETSPMELIPEDRYICSFGHIFSGGYAVGYYSYKWSEVLSADTFAAFEEAGLDDEQALAEIGARFRDTFLALGGSRHPMEIFKDFREREPSTEALLRHTGLKSE